jgi:hypothetical protein
MNDAQFKEFVKQSVKESTENDTQLSVALTLDSRYSAVLAEIQQEKTAVAAMEPESTEQFPIHQPEAATAQGIPQTLAAPDISEVTDEEIIEAAVEYFGQKWNYTEVVQKLLNQFYTVVDESTRKEAEELAGKAHDRFLEENEKEIKDIRKTAGDAVDRAELAQSELKKTSLELHYLKKNKRLPSDLNEKEIEILAQEIQNDLSWLDVSQVIPRPEFPAWIMEGTSLYEGLAKPVCDVNSKFPELVWLPAVQLMLNYLHNKVNIDGMRVNVNMFLGIISEPGKFFKSSSCRLAHEYFQQMGLLSNLNPLLRNAEGKIIIGQAGSSEGFGLPMSQINGKHGLLFSDELGKLVSKAGIENSALPHDLLSWYESYEYSNNIKNPKQRFSFDAGSYCFGWQFCTTTRGFNSQWPRIAGIASGMPDRTFFLLTPKEPKPLTDEVFVPTMEGADKTLKLIQKAYSPATDGAPSGVFRMSQDVRDYAREQGAKFGDPRAMNMVYKFALYFAVDLDLSEVTEGCITRALALVDYRQKATAFLEPIEARNDEGRLLKEIIREIRQHGGKMTTRELYKTLHAEDYGQRFWKMVYNGGIDGNWFREFTEPGKRGQTKKMVGLVKESVRGGPADD